MLELDEKQELEALRRVASRYLLNPMEKAFFDLEIAVDKLKTHPQRVDTVVPGHLFYRLYDALRELKNDYQEFKKEIRE